MFEIVVRAFIKDENGNILLAKRAKEPEKDKWALVGGKVELGEKAIDAVVREVKEELDIIFSPEFVFYGENIFYEKNLHSLILYFSGAYSGKMTVKPDEVQEVKFFSHVELKNMTYIAWDHKEMIDKYLKV